MNQHLVATRTHVLVISLDDVLVFSLDDVLVFFPFFLVCSAPFCIWNEGPVWAATCFEGTSDELFLLYFCR